MKRDDTYDRFDMGMRVVCIKPYKKLKVGGHYPISGCGTLEYSMDLRREDKTGYGFSVGYEDYLNYNNKETYYFTYDEMYEYFITEDEDYKSYLRDQKIEQIINYENRISSTR